MNREPDTFTVFDLRMWAILLWPVEVWNLNAYIAKRRIDMTARILELDAMVRSIEVNKGSPHALFLGAGASLTSGVPSAWTCVLRWKRNIFETKNPALKTAVSEISLPSVQSRIDDWLIANGIWPDDDEDDYSYFIEKCHPIEEDRRRFFQKLIKSANPHTGYKLLGLLAEEGVIRSVWTTNFDGLVAKALLSSSTMSPVEIGIDCQGRIDRQDDTNELICVSLHGDYRYDKLKNTETELQLQEATLEAKLVETLKSQSLIVSGYSGRDRSIMAAFEKAILNQKSGGNIYWCGFSETPPSAVDDLLARAIHAGRQAYYIPDVSFDELNIRLAHQCLTGAKAIQADEIIGSATLVSTPLKTAFSLAPSKTTGLIRSNAFALTLPTEVYSFALKEWPIEGRWKWLRTRSSNNGFNAVPFSNAALAIGTLDQIKDEFGNEIDGEIHRSPITDTDMKVVDGAVFSLVQKSLVQSIASHRGLDTNHRDLVWDPVQIDSVRQGNVTYGIYRCARIEIRLIDSKVHITLDPTYYVPVPDGDVSDGHQEARKYKLGYQHNADYARDLEYWRKILIGDTQVTDAVELDFPPNTAAFKFRLNLRPSYAVINDGKAQAIPLSDNHRVLIKHSGKVFPEPQLLFATEAGWNPSSDTFPLRGLANHGPFDAESVKAMPQNDIQLSIICPKAEAQMLSQFLSTSDCKANAKRPGEYVVDFKGFSDVFRCNLVIPGLSDPNWITLPELRSNQEALNGCQELTSNLCAALTTASALGRSVALILTPNRWEKFRSAETDEHNFDVHDDVKAFAVRKGIATQFLDQDTLSPYDQSRIWWWLSLAIYTKAMRTPWVLKSLDTDSAFVGLGYSIDRGSDRDQKIVLGCSHIYNAQGQGLQFRLRNIQDPRIRRDRNPYLNFNEARQLGEMIRQLFWESHYRLPNRVVIHKLFPFTYEEIKGIKAGLSGVAMLELLEINHEPSLRFLSSRFQNGQFQIDGYPVKRGTALKLSSDELLLWVHGATSAVNDKNTYFQGKRRIPTAIAP